MKVIHDRRLEGEREMKCEMTMNGMDVLLISNKNSKQDSEIEGFPLRSWSIEIYLLNDRGEQVPANVFDKVTYKLHPSFGDRATQSMYCPHVLHYTA